MLKRLLVRRFGLGLLTIWLVSVLVFLGTQVLPGNSAQAILGKRSTPERLAAMEKQLHLDQSVLQQYLNWLGGILTGDPGTSLASQQPVWHLLSDKIVNSAVLMLVAALITIPLSILLGTWAAVRRDRAVDHAISTTTLVLAAVPEFVIGILLVLTLATSVLQVFPAVSLLAPGQYPWNHPAVMVLPALTLILAATPYISRIMRGSMVEVLESEYVQMARLKGMPGRTVIWRHAVPNALVPAVQVSALILAWMAGGVVLVEYVFAYPGVGGALVDAVDNQDIPVVQFLALLAAVLYVTLNLAADVISILLTPRARTARA
ncbi:ABC transporter permease [Nocardioides marmoribigeumensis]|uniref:Peptide/nickel transport system permease protein n=1 Tax=Nocardioides marmoribigeumensis TaxID=433649 RepID=A0ABU2BWZ1_9ACTN|nr:ABC transporter permease [Nocardioides marmoribigeumensis]MDR7362524.1 peptide/nickel transport system permease protein [Nocardioides marmoribigeumensis]